jgi:hypothetical protein
MAHFAEIGLNNTVLRVVVINNDVLLDESNNEVEQLGIDFCRNLFGGTWIQTSYNKTFRKNFAGKGFTYDPTRDAFIPPHTWASWTLNEETLQWEPPIAYPDDGQLYQWNEDNTQWDLIE